MVAGQGGRRKFSFLGERSARRALQGCANQQNPTAADQCTRRERVTETISGSSWDSRVRIDM
jgi:hypothetical protein